MPQDGAPPFIDVLAAQVRGNARHPISPKLLAALDALVARYRELLADYDSERVRAFRAEDQRGRPLDALAARVRDAEKRAEYWSTATSTTASEYRSLQAERDALVARVTEAESIARTWEEIARINSGRAEGANAREAVAAAALADARNALEHYAAPEHWSDDTPPESHNTAGYLAFCYDGGQEFPWTVAREVLARLDGISE